MSSKLSSMMLPDEEGKSDERKCREVLVAISGLTACTEKDVRFADNVDEIKPQTGGVKDVKAAQADSELSEMTPEAREEIKRLAMSQQKSRLQEQRAGHFAYDTFSLPASRVSMYRKSAMALAY